MYIVHFFSHKLNPGELENGMHKEHEEDSHKKVFLNRFYPDLITIFNTHKLPFSAKQMVYQRQNHIPAGGVVNVYVDSDDQR